MKPIVKVINEAIRSADAECLPCDRVNLDYDRHREYLDSDEHRAEDLFENPAPRASAIPTTSIDPSIPSILRYFLDGSRRTYKMADLIVRGRYLPLVAGQVGVATMFRDVERKRLTPMRDFCFFESVLAFPNQLSTKDDLALLANRIREETGQSFALIHYNVKEDRDPVDLGVASIMAHMAGLELRAVQMLVEHQMLHSSSLLVKDGPLQYKHMKRRGFDITQFRNVIGLSKTFRPSFSVGKGRGRQDVGAMTVALEMGERTPVFKTLEAEEGRLIGMWYLRIRPRARMSNPLEGIVKAECYAIDDQEVQDGLDAERIRTISAHLLRERNVTPYGQDSRWATHIYPVFCAERFIKASLLSDIRFEALF
jgi:hypothetical protein